MPDVYLPANFRRTGSDLERDRVSSIPLRGIAQIPDAAHRRWQLGYDDISAELAAECDRAIAAAMAEHKLRREAKLQGFLFVDDDEATDDE